MRQTMWSDMYAAGVFKHHILDNKLVDDLPQKLRDLFNATACKCCSVNFSRRLNTMMGPTQ